MFQDDFRQKIRAQMRISDDLFEVCVTQELHHGESPGPSTVRVQIGPGTAHDIGAVRASGEMHGLGDRT